MSARRHQDEIERLRTATNLRGTNFPSDTQWMMFLSQSLKGLQDRVLSTNPRACMVQQYKFGVQNERETYPLPVSVTRVISAWWEPVVQSTAFPYREQMFPVDGYNTDAILQGSYSGTRWSRNRFYLKEMWPNKQFGLIPPPKQNIPSAVTIEYVAKLPELHFADAVGWTSTSLVFNSTATGIITRSVNDYRDAMLRVTSLSTGGAGMGAFAKITSYDPDTLTARFTAGWRRENNQGSTSGLIIPTGSTLGYQIESPMPDEWQIAALNETAKMGLAKDADAQQRIPLIDATYPLTIQSLINSLEEQSPAANVTTRDVYSPMGGF